MKKVPILLPLLVFAALQLAAQNGKKPPTGAGTPSENPQISWPGKAAVPPASQPFNAGQIRQPISLKGPFAQPVPTSIRVERGENGMPIFMEAHLGGFSVINPDQAIGEQAIRYIAALAPQGLKDPKNEWKVTKVQTDEQGNYHIRLEQQFQGIPVWGSEVICHSNEDAFVQMNGRYFPTPEVADVAPAVSADKAVLTVKNAIGIAKIKTDWSAEELKLIDGQPFSAELCVYHVKEQLDAERLVWHVAARPNVLSRSEWFVDAQNGNVLHHFEHTCDLLGHLGLKGGHSHSAHHEAPISHQETSATVDGPVNINGTDLLGVNRSFTNGGWQVGTQVVLEDASKPMFNAGASNMPSDPVGVIVTVDAFNSSPENQNFNLDLIVSNTTTFSNKQAAISAHYNSIKSFDYYKNKHNRNSIDGVGGNVVAIINVTESDGTSMENAFWNGAAMFYGNGGSVFRPLARGLDVGGHEMTHGVIEKTANLVYQDESGALNESFADVFGQMIDGDANDWKIGEDVMQSSPGLPAALRDLSNPHNGVASNSPFWQPNHMSEKYTGSQDNGGVHINSGITNRAFFLFASDASIGTAKAELVYYKALRDYLVKSSKFVDCRLAVIQAATDLYGAAAGNVAANAFATVGIGGSAPSGNYLGQLSPNPGTDYILATTDDGTTLNLVLGNSGQVIKTIYSQGIKSRPSVTDNGASLVFVNDAGHIIGVDLTYATNPPTVTAFQLSVDPEWRGAAISKDGRFVAAIRDFKEPRIYVFDLLSPVGESETFFLYNPTYSQGQITGDVEYADVLEFDYTGEYLMYDSYNDLDGIGYWDVGFVQFWENDQFTDGGNAFISKLFSGLPEKVGIGDPTFAKNSPYIIAFDLIDERAANTRYDVYGANSETGDYDIIVSNNGVLGWPNYSRLDNRILYENAIGNEYNLRLQPLNSNKIQPQGASLAFANNHYWGVWFANGTRSLMVDSKEPQAATLAFQVMPNPVSDVANVKIDMTEATRAQVTLYNMLGETLRTQEFNLLSGANLLDVNMQELPSGEYVLRMNAENGASGAAVLLKR